MKQLILNMALRDASTSKRKISQDTQHFIDKRGAFNQFRIMEGTKIFDIFHFLFLYIFVVIFL